MKNKLLSLILIVSLLLSTLPTTYVLANNDHANHSEWQKITEDIGISEGKYYLEDDFNLKECLKINNDVIICLNGHNIIRNSFENEDAGQYSIIIENGSLTLCDCKENNSCLTSSENIDACGVKIENGASFNLEDCLVTGFNCTNADGVGVYVSSNATFNIKGNAAVTGNLKNGSENNVYLADGSTMCISGELKENAKIGVLTNINSNKSLAKMAQDVVYDDKYAQNFVYDGNTDKSDTKYVVVADDENKSFKLSKLNKISFDNDKTENGNIEVDKSLAVAGENVTITTKPQSGYEVDKVEVTYLSNENLASLEVKKEDSVYEFKMPDNNVNVSVSFKESDSSKSNDTPKESTEYIISYDANGGIGSMQDTKAEPGLQKIPDCQFTHLNGQNFIGWARTPDGDVFSDYINITEDTKLYAVWDNLAIVTLHPNGAKGDMKSLTVECGEFKLPECNFIAPEGKKFKNWSTSPDGKVELSNESVFLNRDLELYAVWVDKDLYTIRFEPNGGSGYMVSDVTKGGYYKLPGNGFISPEGVCFMGWSLSENGQIIKNKFINIREDITLYPVWGGFPLVLYSVTVDDNDSSESTALLKVTTEIHDSPECETEQTENKEYDGYSLSEVKEVIKDGCSILKRDEKTKSIWEEFELDLKTTVLHTQKQPAKENED
ncbi:MAG: InlB B-repeat-containing protein [Clostridia bacterium]|nr:InlB B-repeat-containing protein [Clostridia bacterium]